MRGFFHTRPLYNGVDNILNTNRVYFHYTVCSELVEIN